MEKKNAFGEGEARGLIGGSADHHIDSTKLPPIHHPLFLNPVVQPEHQNDFAAFVKDGPVWVEIGFGKGLFLTRLALANPSVSILGFEVRYKLTQRTLQRLEKGEAKNARVLLGDARQLLTRFMPVGKVEALFVMFPDPWWKKKHHKKRVLDPTLLEVMRPLLAPGAYVVVRTDVPLVAELAEEVFSSSPDFGAVDEVPFEVPETDRELVCRRIGIAIEERFYRYSGSPGGA